MGKPRENFIRGTIDPLLEKECIELKKRILARGIITDQRLLTRPKLQRILMEKRFLSLRNLPAEEIRRIVLG